MPSPGSDQPEDTHQPRSDMPLQPLSRLPVFGSASDSPSLGISSSVGGIGLRQAAMVTPCLVARSGHFFYFTGIFGLSNIVCSREKYLDAESFSGINM